jgi:hypothetical protein
MTVNPVLIPSVGINLSIIKPPYILVAHLDGTGYPFEYECSKTERGKMKKAEQILEKRLGSGIRRILIVKRGYKILTGIYVSSLKSVSISLDLARVICMGIEVDPKTLKAQRRVLLNNERIWKHIQKDMPKRLIKEAKAILRSKLR